MTEYFLAPGDNNEQMQIFATHTHQSISPCRVSPYSFHFLTLFYMGGGQKDPPGWLFYDNPWGMPQMGWFFMTLFLSILERSLVGHFWNFFLKFLKNFTSTFFFTYIPKVGLFYASKNAFIFVSFLGSKMFMIQLEMHR